MDTTRQNKISRLIQKEISEIMQSEFRNAFGNALITITGVRVTSDLGIARIQLSVFGTKEKETVVKNMNEGSKEIRRHLGNRLKNQLRIIPNIQFFLDDSLDQMEHIEKLLKQ